MPKYLCSPQICRWVIQSWTCYREFHHLVETLKQMNPNSRNRVLAKWCFALLFWPLRQYEWQIPQPTYWPEWFRHSWRGSDNPRKNKREANVNKLTPELSAHGGTKNKSRRYGTPAVTYFYATGSLFIASDGDDGRRKGIILLTTLPLVCWSVSAHYLSIHYVAPQVLNSQSYL